MIRSIVTILILLVPSVSWADTVSKEFDADILQAVSVINTSGNVEISVSTSDKATVTARKILFPEGCQLVIEQSGGKLLVETVEPGGWGKSCRVDFDIRIREATSLDIRNGSGDLDVEGIQGELEFKLGSGDVKVAATVTDLDGTSGSGDVKISGLTGNVKLKTGSGDIELSYDSLPRPGKLKVNSGSGDITIYIPAGSSILTDLSTGSGKIYNEIGDSSGAPFKIIMKSGSGDLGIKKTR
jgi:DUF4097 and DUF4098 domain-containing protein YvlB